MIESIDINYKKPFCGSANINTIGTDINSGKKRKLLPSHIEFKPGLNVVIGNNGSGKTTLLKLIQRASLSNGYFGNVYDRSEALDTVGLGISSLHKTPIDTNIQFKIDFRYPFFMMKEVKDMSPDESMLSFESFGNMFLDKHSSRGESLINQTMSFLKNTAEKWNKAYKRYSIEDICKTIGRGEYDDKIKEYIDRNHKELKPSIVVIMDEPDHGIDIFNLRELESLLYRLSEDAQVIIAIHSHLLIHQLKDKANIIELTPNYLKELESYF